MPVTTTVPVAMTRRRGHHHGLLCPIATLESRVARIRTTIPIAGLDMADSLARSLAAAR